jgi:hypothetical protein
LVAVLAATFVATAGATEAPSKMVKMKWSGAGELPAGAGPVRRGPNQSENLPPVVPGVSAIPSDARGAASGSTIFYDGFEGSVASWSPEGGSYPTWAFFTHRPYAGQWSAYCAGYTGSSFNDPPGPYFNNMNAWLETGPFDLSAVTSASLDFKLWFDTELNYDKIMYMVSVDDQHFYGFGDSGNSQGWVDRSLDLTNVPTLGNVCGRSNVWIAFIFTSDSTNTDEGAYVDDVRISAGGGEVELTLDASPMTVPYRGTVDLSGVLTDADTGFLLPNREVEWLYAQDDNIVRDWKDGGSSFSSTGQYLLEISPLERRTYFILYYAGDSQYGEGFSNFVKVMSRAKLTPPAVPSRVSAGRLITAWGTLMPLHSAQQNRSSHTRIYVQRYSGGKWRSVISLYAQGYKNTASATKYRFGLRYNARGKWRVRAVHQDSDHATTTSSWRTFTVR